MNYREHIDQIIRSFRDYIPCSDGIITHFYAPSDCNVYFNNPNENIVLGGEAIFNVYPFTGHINSLISSAVMDNGFVIKNCVDSGNNTVKKNDLICITYEPYDKKIKSTITDYVKLDNQINEYYDKIDRIKAEYANNPVHDIYRGRFGYVFSMLKELYEDNEKSAREKMNTNIQKVRDKIDNTTKLKLKIKEHLTKFCNNKISELSRYL